MESISRRSLLAMSLGSLVRAQGLPVAKAITRGPRFHWFGYYDKLEFDPTGRYVLANEVESISREHRDFILSATKEMSKRFGREEWMEATVRARSAYG